MLIGTPIGMIVGEYIHQPQEKSTALQDGTPESSLGLGTST